MSEIIEQLYQDHVNMARIVNFLVNQLNLLHDSKTPDYALMTDAMCYMTAYPDLFHHPREEVLFQELKKRDTSVCAAVEELMREHEVLLEKGQQFLESLQLAKTGDLQSPELLESQGRDYIALLRSHMDKEERQVLPLASKVLRPEDWAQIDAAMAFRGGPILGKTVEKGYRALCDFVTRQAG